MSKYASCAYCSEVQSLKDGSFCVVEAGMVSHENYANLLYTWHTESPPLITHITHRRGFVWRIAAASYSVYLSGNNRWMHYICIFSPLYFRASVWEATLDVWESCAPPTTPAVSGILLHSVFTSEPWVFSIHAFNYRPGFASCVRQDFHPASLKLIAYICSRSLLRKNWRNVLFWSPRLSNTILLKDFTIDVSYSYHRYVFLLCQLFWERLSSNHCTSNNWIIEPLQPPECADFTLYLFFFLISSLVDLTCSPIGLFLKPYVKLSKVRTSLTQCVTMWCETPPHAGSLNSDLDTVCNYWKYVTVGPYFAICNYHQTLPSKHSEVIRDHKQTLLTFQAFSSS